jgi:hypothetical protein
VGSREITLWSSLTETFVLVGGGARPACHRPAGERGADITAEHLSATPVEPGIDVRAGRPSAEPVYTICRNPRTNIANSTGQPTAEMDIEKWMGHHSIPSPPAMRGIDI